jgi:hypothetical protein
MEYGKWVRSRFAAHHQKKNKSINPEAFLAAIARL